MAQAQPHKANDWRIRLTAVGERTAKMPTTTSSVALTIGLLLTVLASEVRACHPQFEKERRYLQLYLGIEPENDGEVPSNGES